MAILERNWYALSAVFDRERLRFLFIPVFQFFWIFTATLGLARDLNRYASRNRLRAPPAPVMLGAALAFFFVLTAIPFLGVVPALLNLIIIPLFMRRVYRTSRCLLPENEDRARGRSGRHRGRSGSWFSCIRHVGNLTRADRAERFRRRWSSWS
ncbi:MAG: hypothetical protein EXR98_20760 [Gemmataceae bacterium]|nr:hypothetical protein [Gemmataceae bacterium]